MFSKLKEADVNLVNVAHFSLLGCVETEQLCLALSPAADCVPGLNRAPGVVVVTRDRHEIGDRIVDQGQLFGAVLMEVGGWDLS